MVRLFVDEVLLEHIDLVVPEHAPFGNLAESLHLSSKALVFIDLLHESGVLLRLSRVDGLWPASLSVKHALFASADSGGVNLMNGKVSDVVKLNEVGVSQHVVLVLEVVLGSRVEGGSDRRSVCKLWRPSELAASTGVLVKFSHIFITYPYLNDQPTFLNHQKYSNSPKIRQDEWQSHSPLHLFPTD